MSGAAGEGMTRCDKKSGGIRYAHGKMIRRECECADDIASPQTGASYSSESN
jgi:hypothetical protein